jgi:hypothetical protein
MTQLKKAELIAGVVYMAAAVRAKNSGKPHANLIGWLTAYEVATPGVETLDNTTVRLDGDNQPQPDALWLFVTLYAKSTDKMPRQHTSNPKIPKVSKAIASPFY